MMEHTPVASQAELQPLLELTQRVGNDPLLTQASTGNSSAKLDGVLWIKASGKWMADAMRDDILHSVGFGGGEANACGESVDPAERYPRASLETAMHAALPHRMVLHVHCVNTIAWAVRSDAPMQLQRRLAGLRWQWIPYVASGLPLSREIERALFRPPRNRPVRTGQSRFGCMWRRCAGHRRSAGPSEAPVDYSSSGTRSGRLCRAYGRLHELTLGVAR